MKAYFQDKTKSAEFLHEYIQEAAAEIGVALYDDKRVGRRVQFTIRPIRGRANPWQKVSHSGRKAFASCFRGHRELFRAVYRRDPGVTFSAGDVTYLNSEHFERTYQEVGYQNIGSQVEPLEWKDACTCPYTGEV